MNAEQYRALVNKLESIQEAATDADSLAMAQASAGSQTGTTTGSVPADDNSEVLKQIEHAPTFKQAYAMATKAGLKKFKWCQCKEYVVKDKPVVNPQPAGPRAEYGGTPRAPRGSMVPGTYYPDPNAGGYTATYK
jgi:hypothetical protein